MIHLSLQRASTNCESKGGNTLVKLFLMLLFKDRFNTTSNMIRGKDKFVKTFSFSGEGKKGNVNIFHSVIHS